MRYKNMKQIAKKANSLGFIDELACRRNIKWLKSLLKILKVNIYMKLLRCIVNDNIYVTTLYYSSIVFIFVS